MIPIMFIFISSILLSLYFTYHDFLKIEKTELKLFSIKYITQHQLKHFRWIFTLTFVLFCAMTLIKYGFLYLSQ